MKKLGEQGRLLKQGEKNFHWCTPGMMATYEWAFRSIGFKAVHWQKPIVSPQGVEEFGQEFWQDFLDYMPIVGIECLK